jgi:hypothetical protein
MLFLGFEVQQKATKAHAMAIPFSAPRRYSVGLVFHREETKPKAWEHSLRDFYLGAKYYSCSNKRQRQHEIEKLSNGVVRTRKKRDENWRDGYGMKCRNKAAES